MSVNTQKLLKGLSSLINPTAATETTSEQEEQPKNTYSLSNQEDISSTLSSSYAGANIGILYLASVANSNDLPSFLASRTNGNAQIITSPVISVVDKLWPYFAADSALVVAALIVRRA